MNSLIAVTGLAIMLESMYSLDRGMTGEDASVCRDVILTLAPCSKKASSRQNDVTVRRGRVLCHSETGLFYSVKDRKAMAKVARKSPRNYEIAKGIMRWTRSAAYAKKGLYKIKDKKVWIFLPFRLRTHQPSILNYSLLFPCNQHNEQYYSSNNICCSFIIILLFFNILCFLCFIFKIFFGHNFSIVLLLLYLLFLSQLSLFLYFFILSPFSK